MILSGVYFNYCKIREPGKKYQSELKEYSVDVVLSKKQAAEWKQQWPKNRVKIVSNKEYEDIYKTPAPFEGQSKQYIVKLKKPFSNKDGVPIPARYRPRVYQRDGDVLREITSTVYVGNGSKGDVEIDTITNSFGTFPVLKNIAVSDLVEYEGAGSTATALGRVVESEERSDDDEDDGVSVAGESLDDDDGFDFEDDDDIPF